MSQNSKVNTIECVTAKEFWDILSPLNKLAPEPCNFLYRGQRNSEWGLQPSIFRTGNYVERIFGRKEISCENRIFGEIRVLEQFAEYCDLLGLKIPKDSVEFREKHLSSANCDKFYKDPALWPNEELIEVMALGQHHGLPTRLLDWTRRSYIAAFFAATDAIKSNDFSPDGKRIAVWALDIENKGLYRNLKIVRVPGSTSVNLAAQNGVFTIIKQGGSRGELFAEHTLEEEIATLRKSPLWKITLPHSECMELIKICSLHGITSATLFPGYEGAVKSVEDSINTWARIPNRVL